MKKIGFIGAYDKTDLILYIAKILTAMNKSVLVIDTTITQKAKYVVPAVNPAKAYVTTYEEIDVAVGFRSYEELLGYLGVEDADSLNYDFALIDVDTSDRFDRFSMEDADTNYFVTSFDLYSLKKGLEILSVMQDKIKMTKVLFSKYMSNAENEYLDFLSQDYNIDWEQDRINFPLEQGDQAIIIENQRASKIKTKRLSLQFREGLLIIAGHISGNENLKELKKLLKKIDKGV